MRDLKCPYCLLESGHSEDCPHHPGEVATAPSLRIITTIPPEVEQYRTEIAQFVEAMVYKLGVKAHKGKWENRTAEESLQLLQQEVGELTEAIRRGNMVEVLLESADVANFALIISAIVMARK